MTAGAATSSIPSCVCTSIFAVSNSFVSGGISSFFTSSSFTILGGVNFCISTLGGSCLGGGGGGGSGFFSSSWSDRKSTRLNSSHSQISYAVFCLKKKPISVNNYN